MPPTAPARRHDEAGTTGSEDLRSLSRPAEREADLERAGTCAASLDDDAVRRLEEALADPSLYNPARAARMAVLESGLEPGSDAAEIVWMRTFERALAERGLLDPDDPIAFPDATPPPPRRTPTERKARKKQRKSARKARRKNR